MGVKSTNEPRTRARIALVDDHPMILRGLGDLISSQKDMTVCWKAGNETECWESFESNSPDLIVLDLMLQKRNALQLLKRLKTNRPEVKVAILTLHPEEVYGDRALGNCADGYISKEKSSDEILRALRIILGGGKYFSDQVLEHDGVSDASPGGGQEHELGASLTARELEVFELIGHGLGTKQIASQLRISPKTVETHQFKLREKLNASSGRELTRRALLWLAEQT